MEIVPRTMTYYVFGLLRTNAGIQVNALNASQYKTRQIPTITCPDDITIECGDDVPVTSATAVDNCDENVDVTYSDSDVMGNCPMVIVRNVCGNRQLWQYG